MGSLIRRLCAVYQRFSFIDLLTAVYYYHEWVFYKLITY